MIGIKSKTPKNLFHRFHSILFKSVNGNPVVNGPAYTAGARAIKTDSLFPSEGHMPRESEMKVRPLPCE
jgi:hypothetical protein